MEPNECLKDQLARLQEDLAVRLTDSGTESEPTAEAEELASDTEFDEFDELDPKIQPENQYPVEDPAEFKSWRQLGPRSERFFALPRPRWPNPGTLVTPEVKAAYRAEENLCIEAGSRLLLFVNWLRHEKRWAEMMPPPMEGEETRLTYDRARYRDAEQLAAEHLAWLTGLWRSRGIPVPTIEEIEAMPVVRGK